MVARVHSIAFNGIEVLDVDVQVQMSNGPARLHHRRPAGQGGVGSPRTVCAPH